MRCQGYFFKFLLDEIAFLSPANNGKNIAKHLLSAGEFVLPK